MSTDGGQPPGLPRAGEKKSSDANGVNLRGQIGAILFHSDLHNRWGIDRLAFCKASSAAKPSVGVRVRGTHRFPAVTTVSRKGTNAPFSFPPATRARVGCWRMIKSNSELGDNIVSGKAGIAERGRPVRELVGGGGMKLSQRTSEDRELERRPKTSTHSSRLDDRRHQFPDKDSQREGQETGEGRTVEEASR